MNPVRSLLAATETLFDRVLCVAGAVIFAQFPEFLQQYLQRLGGHLDEARRLLAQFEAVAARSNLTAEALARQTAQNADAAVAKLSGVITDTIARVQHLESAQAALQNASLWTRPFAFLRHADADIARGTWGIFKPAVPTTVEGLIYALAGMVILLSLYHGAVKYPLRCWARRSRRLRAEAGSSG
jgi:hypothetical protein